MDQLHPELDNVLQCLSLNGYSVFSLINDILARGNWEDERIKILREGIERDASDICARLQVLSHTSGPERVLKFGQVHLKDHRHAVAVPIDILPDNVFLEIFNFCIDVPFELESRHTRWRTLVHVCQRWRGIIFASPRRLDLYLECSYGTPVRMDLVFWPANLPLILNYRGSCGPISPEDEENIVAVLEHPGRVRRINIHAKAPLIEKVVTTLQKSFPALTDLDLTCLDSVRPLISSGFLEGSSIPHLQHLRLKHISLPQLPLPFLSTCNLVSLELELMHANGYISPEAMVRSLAMLSRLKHLSISFDEVISSSDSSHPYSQMRAILPALTQLEYEGCSEYLEDFLARIDSPRVDSITIEYVRRRLGDQIQALQLSRFIERTENLKIDQFTRAQLQFYPRDYVFGLNRSHESWGEGNLRLKIRGGAVDDSEEYTGLESQVQYMAQLLGQLAAMFSKVDDLFTHGSMMLEGWYMMDITEWLPLFHLFPAVETLRLSGSVAVHITAALESITEEIVTHVFPVLRMIRIVECEGRPREDDDDDRYGNWVEDVRAMEQFLSLRQLSGLPVTVIKPDDELAEVEQRW